MTVVPATIPGAFTQPQKQILQTQAVVDTFGNCTLTWAAPPMGLVFTGAITILNAPNNTTWNVEVNGVIIDVATNTNTIGNIQVGVNEALSLVCNNGSLLAYVGVTIIATFVASATDAATTPLVIPAHDAFQATPTAQGQFIAHLRTLSVANNQQTATVNVPSGYNFIGAFLQGGGTGPPPSTLLIQGKTSGWAVLNLNGTSNPLAINGFYQGILPQGIDSQIVILLNNGSAGTIIEGWFYAFTAPMGAVPIWLANGIGVTPGGGLALPVSIDGLTTPNPLPVAINGLTAPNPLPVAIDGLTTPNPLPVEGVQGPQTNAVMNTTTDPSVHTPHTSTTVIAPAAGTLTALLAAPSAGKCWEIISLFATTSVLATSTNILVVQGATSAQTFWEPLQINGQTFYGAATLAAPAYINEGLVCKTSAGAAITFFVVARQVPLV